MKITIETTIEKEVDLPLYFKSKRNDSFYFMTVGEKSAIRVVDHEFNADLMLYPSIEVISKGTVGLYVSTGFTPISETEFKNIYLKVSLELEKLMN
ncbi:MAG TPA: hypothetical protein VIH28_08345 [Ignavibacteriaceae bacterium]